MGLPSLSTSPVTLSFLISETVDKAAHAHIAAAIKAHSIDEVKRHCDGKGRSSSSTAKKRQYKTNTKLVYDIKIKTEQLYSIHKNTITSNSHINRHKEDHPINNNVIVTAATTATNDNSVNLPLLQYRHKPILLGRSDEKNRILS
jgi:hypothetical protein